MYPENHGKKWSINETIQLMKEIKILTIDEIAKNHKRTNKAIFLKLIREAAKLADNDNTLDLYDLSIITTSQKYSDLLTSSRENANGAIFFNCSNKQLELIEADHNYLGSKKEFMNMFRKVMNEKHSFSLLFLMDCGSPYPNFIFEVL
jgi:hypothetical protein